MVVTKYDTHSLNAFDVPICGNANVHMLKKQTISKDSIGIANLRSTSSTTTAATTTTTNNYITKVLN